MAATSFQTETSTFRKLIGNGLTYRIPPFQRDYSWTEEEWEDLWTDLMSTVEAQEEPAHYMGYVVLQARSEKAFDVIDGQRRLTTLTLLVLAVLKHLQRLIDSGEQAESNQQRLEALRRTYVGSLDPVSLTAQSKLTLNRNNDAFFQQYLVTLQKPRQRGLTLSERALKVAFEWFDERIGEYLERHPGDRGVELAQLVEAMSDKLFFTVIHVTDELNAYRVFETLNARGVKLSSTDLLKNYLFSVLSRDKASKRDDLPELERRWDSLVGGLGSDDFPEFLRAHWLSQGRFVRHADLFKAVSKAVVNRAQVFTLLRELDEDLDRYVALRSPAASALSPKAKELASQLKLFHVKQPYPLLMAAMRAFPGELEDVLRACVTISFRYNVIGGLSPGEQEPVFADAARAIAEGSSRGAADVIRSLARVYPSDEQFKSAFVEKLFTRGKEKLARFVLCEFERQLAQVPIDRDSDTLSLEHVLPQAPQAGWDAFADQEVDAMTFLIGNMVLLRKGPNSNLGNRPYSEKRPILASSEFEATRKLAEENAEWTPERLVGRQNQLANLAASIWKISQLS